MELVQNVVDALGEHVALLDKRGKVVAVNRAWCRFSRRNGGPKGGYLQRNYLDVCKQAVAAGDEEARLPLEGIRDVLQKKRSSFQYEYPCHSPTEQSWFLMVVTALTEGAIVTHSEVTWERRRETSLAVSEHRLKEVFNALGVALYLTDSAGRVLFWNRAAENMTEHLQAPVRIGTPFEQLLPGTAKPLFDRLFALALSGAPQNKLRVADLWLELSYHPIFEHGRLSEVCVSVENISTKKGLEAALREHQKEAPFYLAHTPLAVVEWSVQHTLSAWNPAAERMFGLNARDVTGAPLDDVFGTFAQNLEKPPHDTFFLQADAVKVPVEKESVTYKWLCTPLRDSEGAGAGTVAFIVPAR